MDKEELRTMWMAGVPVHEIARHFRVSKSTVNAARRRLKIPDRPNKYRERDVDPTPDEIKERARECRERHLAERRAEKDETSRNKAWRHSRDALA